MTRIITGAALVALLGMGGMHSPVQAADLVQFRDNTSGRGTIRLPNGRTDQIRRAEVRFQRGGSGRVTLVGNREYEFNGRWSNGNGQRLEFRITKALDNENTPGDATLRFRGENELTELTLNSRGIRPVYNASFKADRDGSGDNDWDGGWDNSSVSGRGNGKGTLKIESKDDERLRRYSVELRKGGEATLTLQGERDPRILRGRWRSVDNRTAEIRLEEIFGDRGDDSRGRIKLYFTGGNNRTRRLDRLEGQGKSRNRDFSLNFDTDNQGGGSGGGNQPGGEVGVIASRNGTGNLNITGRRDEFLKEASVRLERNGDATFRFTTDEATFTVQGKWYKRPNSATMLDVDIDRYGDASASGRGTVELSFGSTRSFSRIELNGQTGGAKLVVSFRAQ